jgi:hypothetical protein
MAAKNTVIVRSVNILKPPLLVTKEAMAIEMYDDSGELMAVVHLVLDGNYWALTTRQDPDWGEVLKQLGYLTTHAELDLVSKEGFLNGR